MEVFHDFLHFLHTGAAVEFVGVQRVQAVAIGRIEFVQFLQQGDTPGSVEGEHFADHEGGIHPVLVPDISSREISVGLFKPADIVVRSPALFQSADHLADELEAGENIDRFNVIVRRDLFRQVHRHNRLDKNRMCRHFTVPRPLRTDIVQQQQADLVSGKQLIIPVGGPHRNSAAVAVRIGCQQQVSVLTSGILQAQRHRLPDLRVRIRAGWEVPVGLSLLFHHGNVGESAFLQRAGNRLQSRSVQRAVDYGNITVNSVSVEDRLGLHFFDKRRQDFLSDIPDASGLQRVLKISALHIPENIQAVDFRKDACRGFRRDLTAIRSVNLVAVVFGRIVRCRDHHAGRGPEPAHGKADGRHWQKLRPEMDRDAIGGKHSCRRSGKNVAFDPTVVADHNACSLAQGIGQSLARLGNDIDIHPIGPRADHAAQAARAKGQIAIERVFDLRLIHSPQFFQHVSPGVCKPSFIFRFVIHRS